MKTKTFDCVEMMHGSALRIYEETKNMTVDEEVVYWQKHPSQLRKNQKESVPYKFQSPADC